jgi:hypothetical protein
MFSKKARSEEEFEEYAKKVERRMTGMWMMTEYRLHDLRAPFRVWVRAVWMMRPWIWYWLP